MKKKAYFAGLCASLMMAGNATAQGIDPVVYESAVFGISRQTGNMWRHNFHDQSTEHLGKVHNESGADLVGIDAGAYIPGHQNIIAFWPDSAANVTRMMYVNTQSALATPVGQHLGAGAITGAVAATNGNADVSGEANINPNNSPQAEFVMNTGDGLRITRDDLQTGLAVDADGAIFNGTCTYLRFKPKGNGNQNGLVVNGAAFSMNNGKQYTLVGLMNVTVYNDSVSNGLAMGHWWVRINSGKAYVLENGNMVAGGSTGNSHWAVYALQDWTAAGGDTIDFNIVDDNVVPTEPFALKITVLGAAISASGDYDMPVTTKFIVGGAEHTPFGSFSQPVNGNVNDNQNPRSYVFEGTFSAGTNISVVGKSWSKKKSHYNGNSNNHWNGYLEADGSSSNSQQIKVLRHGDPVPDIEGYLNQDNVEDFVSDYIDQATNTIVLGENEAIYLFELGTTNMDSSAADFQDLVVLVSLASSADEFDGGGAATPQSRLIKVDHRTGGYSTLMTLANTYDGLATSDSLTFYATRQNQMYEINIANQTETLVGTMSNADVLGLECVGSMIAGFTHDNDTLLPMSVSTGGMLGSAADVGMHNLGTLIFMPMDVDPRDRELSYD